jgi:hypothetical protein
MASDYESVVSKHQALVDIRAQSMLRHRIVAMRVAVRDDASQRV